MTTSQSLTLITANRNPKQEASLHFHGARPKKRLGDLARVVLLSLKDNLTVAGSVFFSSLLLFFIPTGTLLSCFAPYHITTLFSSSH
jgi:hypothetical protein